MIVRSCPLILTLAAVRPDEGSVRLRDAPRLAVARQGERVGAVPEPRRVARVRRLARNLVADHELP